MPASQEATSGKDLRLPNAKVDPNRGDTIMKSLEGHFISRVTRSKLVFGSLFGRPNWGQREKARLPTIISKSFWSWRRRFANASDQVAASLHAENLYGPRALSRHDSEVPSRRGTYALQKKETCLSQTRTIPDSWHADRVCKKKSTARQSAGFSVRVEGGASNKCFESGPNKGSTGRM